MLQFRLAAGGKSRADLPVHVRICGVVVVLVALRRVAPRKAAQGFHPNQVFGPIVPPLHAAGLSQLDNRHR